jgi:hypothetical protein
MDALALIFKIRCKGYSVIANGSFLDIFPTSEQPSGAIPAELIHQLEKNKPEILCALHRETELVRLVFLVCTHHNYSEEEYQKTMSYALEDQANSLVRFAGYAHKLGLLEL